jgi:hypothetical protein
VGVLQPFCLSKSRKARRFKKREYGNLKKFCRFLKKKTNPENRPFNLIFTLFYWG